MAVSSSISQTHVSKASRFCRKVSEFVDASLSARPDRVPFKKTMIKHSLNKKRMNKQQPFMISFTAVKKAEQKWFKETSIPSIYLDRNLGQSLSVHHFGAGK